MKQSDHVGKFFDDVTQSMRLKFRGWEKDLPHEGEKGGIRERRVADFLKSILPHCFGIGSGHIIDTLGNTSGQIDIVIYNALDGIRLPIDEYYSLFPCESVHAVIEIKSTLSASSGKKPSGSIHDCVEATTKVKALKKVGEITPNDIPCIIFAYRSGWKDEPEKEIAKWFQKFGTGKSLPEIVYILDPGILLLCKNQKETIYSQVYKEAPLLQFVDELLTRLQQVKVSGPGLLNDYLNWDKTG
jgi:hypothetical protein